MWRMATRLDNAELDHKLIALNNIKKWFALKIIRKIEIKTTNG